MAENPLKICIFASDFKGQLGSVVRQMNRGNTEEIPKIYRGNTKDMSESHQTMLNLTLKSH